MRKGGRTGLQKGVIQMKTTMIFGYLRNEWDCEALGSKQGLSFAYTFLREREHGM